MKIVLLCFLLNFNALVGKEKIVQYIFNNDHLTRKPLVQKEINRNPLTDRLSIYDKRYRAFNYSFQLMEERGAKILVETGTAREGNRNFVGDGGSTILFADWAFQHPGAILYSVDINLQCLETAKSAIKPYINSVKLVHQDAIQFLKGFPDIIDFLYLDSFDFDYNHPELSQLHHLKEIEAAYDKLTPNSIVMIDDCMLPFGGKGKLVIEFLLSQGWKIALDSYQVILIRN